MKKRFIKKWQRMFAIGGGLLLCSLPFLTMANDIKTSNLRHGNITSEEYIKQVDKASSNATTSVQKYSTPQTNLNIENSIIDYFDKQINATKLAKAKLNSSVQTTVSNNTQQNRTEDKELDSETLLLAKQKSLEYFSSFQKGDFTIKDLTVMANENGYTYQDQIKNLNSIQKDAEQSSSSYLIEDQDKINVVRHGLIDVSGNTPISAILDKMQETGIQAGIFAGAAAAVAAGYWALLIFSGGASMFSAITATIQVGLFAVEGSAYGIFYEVHKNSPEYVDIENLKYLNVYNALWWSWSTAHMPKNVINFIFKLKKSITAIKLGIKATSWAAPTGLAFVIFADVTISIADLIVESIFNK